MKKILLSLVAVAFVAGIGTSSPVFAMAHKKELMAACKDKKPGDMVKLKSGKEYKCPKKK